MNQLTVDLDGSLQDVVGKFVAFGQIFGGNYTLMSRCKPITKRAYILSALGLSGCSKDEFDW
jgi:hypothetical protein